EEGGTDRGLTNRLKIGLGLFTPELDAAVETIARAERGSADGRGICHSRQTLKVPKHSIKKRHLRRSLKPVRHRPPNLSREDMLRVEPEVDVGEVQERSRQQPGPDQQNQRECNFGNHERVSQRVRSSTCA